MNKLFKKGICVGVAVLTLSLAACTPLPNPMSASKYYYQKQSAELVHFKSSDSELDFFLNDYFKRHAGWIDENGLDQKVNSVTAGVTSKEFFWQEWMSTAYYPFNSFDGFESDRIEGLRRQLTSVPVDRYGYVWQSSDAVRAVDSDLNSGEHRMGWPFPTSANSDGMSISWDFNGEDTSTWSTNFGATVKGGLLNGETETPMNSIEFLSPYPEKATQMIASYYTPLLEIDLRMYTPDADNIEDVRVWYTTNDSPEWSEDKCVSVNEKAFIAYDYTPIYEHMIFLPMYAEEAWKSDKDLETYIKQIKLEIVPKTGKTISGEFGLSYVRTTLDTRHSNNNSIFISSLRQDYDYTGDIEFLKANITKARKAINFFMQMYDESRRLNDQSYLVGHDADVTSSYASERTVMSLSNGYWDISFMPKFDFQSNMFFYKALVDLAYLENVLTENGVTVDTAEAAVLAADRKNYSHSVESYDYTAETLTQIANDVLIELRKPINNDNKTGFWSEETGRFVAGYAEAEDKWYDYGYTMWNLEAIYYGVATEAQAKSIMDWVSGARTVEMDKYGSQGEDIYYYEFAPRVNTYSPEDQFDASILNGFYRDNKIEYGITQVQNGGAIMYVSFYDLMGRASVYGANDAYSRLKSIKDWYMDVYDYYTQSDNYNRYPNRFYWDYYEKSQWHDQYVALQNGVMGMRERGDTTGILGLDGEFLESFLMIAAIPYGFFGIDSIGGNVLQIAPALPDGLEYWGVENLAFRKVKYDLTTFKNSVRIDSVRGDAAGVSVQIILETNKANPNVYVNGKQTNNYAVKDGKVYVTLPLQACSVEIQ